MNTTPKNCPFCGSLLAPVMAANGRDVSTWSHPRGDCYYQGVSVGSTLIPKWNQRSDSGAIHMEVVDDHPVFNTEGRGRIIDIGMVNATISYYRRKADEQDH